MPNYEYRCEDCHRRFEVFFSYADYGKEAVLCPRCGSANVHRKIGRIRVAHSDESRLENMADPATLDGLDENPEALGRMMRQMSSQLGEDMGPEFDEVVGRLEAGQTPDKIEEELPGLGADESGAGMDMGGGLVDDF
ncbi:MAG: zinc ribbon domain-containing protein [Chloroflexi bacterium]|nr:zinc ribbon domain-containing protein [Chloroflexota bacterium]